MIKNRKLLSIFGLALSLAIASVGASQNRNAQLDPAFSAFWIKFKDAIAKNDKQRVADLTKLPFTMDSIDYDRAGFIKEYPKLFTPRMRRCIARAKPMKDQDNYEVFCSQQIFLFLQVDGVWKFVTIGVND